MVRAKNGSSSRPADFLQFGSQGPPPLTKFWTPYRRVDGGSCQVSTRFGWQRAVLAGVADDGTGPQRYVLTVPVGVWQPGSPKMMIATSWVSNPGALRRR